MTQINKRNIGTCIVLSFVTFGIYSIYWEYLLVKNIRSIKKDDSSCVGEMLCLLFVPFYSLYWWFTRGKSVRDEFSKHGYSVSSNETAFLVLALFGLGIVAMAIMQNDFNSLPSESDQLNQQSVKIIEADTPTATVKETVVVSANNASAAPLLERAFLFLEDGKWQDANIYCEKVLDIDPKNAEAYLGKLMAELQVNNRKKLADCAEPFDDRDNYTKVIRFGNEGLDAEMRGYITHINERNENARLTDAYNKAVNSMNTAKTENAYNTRQLSLNP